MSGLGGFIGCENKQIIREMANSLQHRGKPIIYNSVFGNGLKATEEDGIFLLIDGNFSAEKTMGLIKEKGLSAFNELNGGFAFYLKYKNEEYVGRDFFGEKPLFYSFLKNKLVFASELKAILKTGISKEINEEAIIQTNILVRTIGEETLFKNIRYLEPGTILRSDGKKIKICPVFNRKVDFKQCVNESEKENQTLFYSGGLDSTSILVNCSKPINTMTLGDEETIKEVEFATVISDKYSTNHKNVVLDFETLIKELPFIVLQLEGMNRGWGFYILGRATKEYNIITGEGADTVLGDLDNFSVENRIEFLKKKITKFKREDMINKVISMVNKYGNRIHSTYLSNDALLFIDHSFGFKKNVINPFLDLRMKISKNKEDIKKIVIDKGLKPVVKKQKIGLPQSTPKLWKEFEKLANYLIGDDYLNKHKFKKCFLKKSDVLWFDMFYKMFIEDIQPKEFKLEEFY